MTLGVAWVIAWANEAAVRIAENHTSLGDLDRAIGDGDHGVNLDRGFSAVAVELNHIPETGSPAGALRVIGTTLISSVGGAAGPLYGTAFLRAAESAAGRDSLDGHAVADLLASARNGIVERGKAEVGDKTMVDAWTPAVDAARAAAEEGGSPHAVLEAAAEAAASGAAATEPLIARKGRASYLGERAIGHRDPGAQSSVLIIQAAADVAHDH